MQAAESSTLGSMLPLTRTVEFSSVDIAPATAVSSPLDCEYDTEKPQFQQRQQPGKRDDDIETIYSTDTSEMEDDKVFMAAIKRIKAYKQGRVTDNDGDADSGDGGTRTWKYKLRIFFESPNTKLAMVYHALSGAIVLLSIMMMCLDTLPSLRHNDRWLNRVSWPLNLFFLVFFGTELALRYTVSNQWIKFWYSIMNVLELVSLVPLWLDVFQRDNDPSKVDNPATNALRLLRALRIVRLFRFVKYSIIMVITFRAVRKSLAQIGLVLFIVFASMIAVSTLMYFLEQEKYDVKTGLWMRTPPNGSDGPTEVSPFQSIFTGLWWAITTLTTTGYGDVVPYTLGGKIVAGVTMMIGIHFLAIAASILASNFTAEHDAYMRAKAKLREKKTAAKQKTIQQLSTPPSETGSGQAAVKAAVMQIETLLASMAAEATVEELHRLRERCALLEIEVESLRSQLAQIHSNDVE
ncbi:voltage-gated potassium channel [Ramicandelaber brevisporus]|nr:voltage-gated potassium channel [Ramicandelaber brevisporus]